MSLFRVRVLLEGAPARPACMPPLGRGSGFENLSGRTEGGERCDLDLSRCCHEIQIEFSGTGKAAGFRAGRCDGCEVCRAVLGPDDRRARPGSGKPVSSVNGRPPGHAVLIQPTRLCACGSTCSRRQPENIDRGLINPSMY